jgi:hypothetical protein
MKALSRDSWLAIGLLLAVVSTTATAAIYEARQASGEATPPTLSTSSAAPDGAKALWLWLDELGHTVSNQVADPFRPAEDSEVVFVLEPTTRVTAEEWETLEGWLDEGGVLVIVGERWGTAVAARHFGFQLVYLDRQAGTVVPQNPLFTSPPLGDSVSVQAQACLEEAEEAPAFVTLLAAEACPVLVSIQQGPGQVVISTAPFSFSNAGLKEAGNPELVLNLVAGASQGGGIWFDEWHQGRRPQRRQLTGPEDWLRYTAAGRSLLYLTGVTFVTLVLRGRRLGRPVPVTKAVSRRAPLEYITAIANLNRRAGHRSATLRRYQHQLKRDLGKRYRLAPTLPDNEYVAQLAQFNPNLDASALRSLLAHLGTGKASESEMIQWAAQVADWLKES